MRDLRALVKEIVTPAIPSILHQANVHRDGFDDEIEKTIGGVRIEFAKKVPKTLIKDAALTHAKQINTANAAQMDAVFTTVLGVPLGGQEGIDDIIASSVRQNVSLIEGLADDVLKQIERIVSQGARTGARASDMAAEIFQRADVSESRAQLIARDQSGKLFGNLSQHRQQNAGVTKFIWRTSLDEKVRPSHAALEGKTFDWSNPPDIGVPGEDFQCRCTPEPVLDDILNELGPDLGE
jgi:SPP1 gp7 family putative phage head morphogenesis protein